MRPHVACCTAKGTCVNLYLVGPLPNPFDPTLPVFQTAAELLVALGHTVVFPDPTNNPDVPFVTALRRNLTELLACDGIITLPGWRESRHATAEVTTALVVEMPIYLFLHPDELAQQHLQITHLRIEAHEA